MFMEAKRGCLSLWNWVTGHCKLPCAFCEPNLGPLQEHWVPLTSELSLVPILLILFPCLKCLSVSVYNYPFPSNILMFLNIYIFSSTYLFIISYIEGYKFILFYIDFHSLSSLNIFSTLWNASCNMLYLYWCRSLLLDFFSLLLSFDLFVVTIAHI